MARSPPVSLLLGGVRVAASAGLAGMGEAAVQECGVPGLPSVGPQPMFPSPGAETRVGAASRGDTCGFLLKAVPAEGCLR